MDSEIGMMDWRKWAAKELIYAKREMKTKE
jgi:hypothetical protein